MSFQTDQLLSIKWDMQGLLIYSTMAGYLISALLAILATVAHYISKPISVIIHQIAKIVFFVTFLISLASLIYRWIEVEHLPMQNMFEVFLVLGFCIWPIYAISNRFLGKSHPTFILIDAFIGLIVLFPAGFVFDHQPQFLPPALQFWLFGPHVAAYMLSYIFIAKAAVFAFVALILAFVELLFAFISFLTSRELVDRQKILTDFKTLCDYSYRLVAAGFPLLTLGLFLGSIWGKYAWGDWWGWDPKELWSLVCWLVLAIYLHYRYAYPKSLRIQNILVILGLVAIIITLLWVNLSKIFGGLHNYAS
ncbi:MAG: cytochrome c biogenesis protein CcsA [Planctomycetota bacterium]|jgi:cytochrome c-type biogenesis protein CcsB